MFCPKCGKELPQNSQFCNYCGYDSNNSRFNSQAQPYNQQQYAASPLINPNTYAAPIVNEDNIPYNYKPLSPWAYFGYTILFCLPIVGFIMLLVYALSNTGNINLRNYARSYFCLLIILLVLLIPIAIIAALAGMSFSDIF